MEEEIKTEEEIMQDCIKRIKKKIEQKQEEIKNIKDIKEYMNDIQYKDYNSNIIEDLLFVKED